MAAGAGSHRKTPYDLKLVELETVEQRENDLRIIFEKKAQQAANLEAYEQQLEEMR